MILPIDDDGRRPDGTRARRAPKPAPGLPLFDFRPPAPPPAEAFDDPAAKPVEKLDGKTLEEAFRDFHRDNPEVLELFAETARRLLRETRRSTIGAKLVVEAIRWRAAGAPATEGASAFRLPNAHTAFYARLAAFRFPDLAHAFRFASQAQDDAFDASTVVP